jgi:hypothetical protein
MEISSLLETASRNLAVDKAEMKALLSQWKALADQEKGDPRYPAALGRALQILDRCASLPEFLAKLRLQEQQNPNET